MATDKGEFQQAYLKSKNSCQMRRNCYSSSTLSLSSLGSIGNPNGTNNHKWKKLPFLGNKKSMSLGKSSVSLVSLDGKRSSTGGSTPTKKQNSLLKNSKSMPSLKSLQKESFSRACFSHLATPSALLRLEELDTSLEQIGHSAFHPISRLANSNTICELSEHESDEIFPVLLGEDDATRNLASSPREKSIQRVHRDNFHRVCKIGRGCYSEVFMVLDHKREKCALKALDPSRLKNSEAFVSAAQDLASEALMLSKLDHENIVQLRGLCSATFSTSYTEGTDGGYFLVLELLNDVLSNSLDRWRKSNRQSSDVENKWAFGKSRVNIDMMYGRMQSVALGIVKGMVYLHENGIVLRDLKPANVGFDEGGNVRLFDFGMARKLEDCDPDEICGSPIYMPPEVMTRKGYSFEVDVYSFGIVLYEICSLKVAFNVIRKHADIKEFNLHVIEHNRPKLNNIACPLTTKLIEDCWQGDPTQRPSFQKTHQRIVDIIS